MHIKSSVARLERLLEAEEIAEIYKDAPQRYSIKHELQALREKWKREKYINQTAASTARKRRHGNYSLADERLNRKYDRALNIMRAKNEAFILYGGSVILGIVVLLSL
tara:strand:- start:501 stop:824 length:324 start_codon:yes stop_codon:yes gene_type:complete